MCVIRTSDNTVVETVEVGERPWGVTVSPDGDYVYTADFLERSASVIQTLNRATIGEIKESISDERVPLNDIAATPDGELLYIASTAMPHWEPDDPYVHFDGKGEVAVVRTTDYAIIDHVGVGDLPTCITISPDGDHAYVTNANDNSVSVIRTSDNTVIDTIAVGASPDDIVFSQNGDFIYLANNDDNTIMQIRSSDHSIVNTIAVGDTPWSIAASPDNGHIYVSNFNDNTVLVIDISMI